MTELTRPTMYLTRAEYDKKVAALNSKYWNEGKEYRWQYMSKVIEFAKEICPDGIVMEAGASGIPLNDKSFLFDYPEYDLNKPPYEIHFTKDLVDVIPSRSFDLFIALQTWEHLDNQQDAFREVMRISKAAILSFPYKWGRGHDARHTGIDDKKIAEWTCSVKPVKTMVINKRAIYVWVF